MKPIFLVFLCFFVVNLSFADQTSNNQENNQQVVTSDDTPSSQGEESTLRYLISQINVLIAKVKGLLSRRDQSSDTTQPSQPLNMEIEDMEDISPPPVPVSNEYISPPPVPVSNMVSFDPVDPKAEAMSKCLSNIQTVLNKKEKTAFLSKGVVFKNIVCPIGYWPANSSVWNTAYPSSSSCYDSSQDNLRLHATSPPPAPKARSTEITKSASSFSSQTQSEERKMSFEEIRSLLDALSEDRIKSAKERQMSYEQWKKHTGDNNYWNYFHKYTYGYMEKYQYPYSNDQDIRRDISLGKLNGNDAQKLCGHTSELYCNMLTTSKTWSTCSSSQTQKGYSVKRFGYNDDRNNWRQGFSLNCCCKKRKVPIPDYKSTFWKPFNYANYVKSGQHRRDQQARLEKNPKHQEEMRKYWTSKATGPVQQCNSDMTGCRVVSNIKMFVSPGKSSFNYGSITFSYKPNPTNNIRAYGIGYSLALGKSYTSGKLFGKPDGPPRLNKELKLTPNNKGGTDITLCVRHLSRYACFKTDTDYRFTCGLGQGSFNKNYCYSDNFKGDCPSAQMKTNVCWLAE